MKRKFFCTILFAAIWLTVSIIFSLRWIQEVSCFLPAVYVWWVVIGIALLPGFLMSGMFFSNLLHSKHKKYPCTCENVTVMMCAHNEEKTVKKAIRCICNQSYQGHITLLVIDNCSSDCTKKEIIQSYCLNHSHCTIKYLYCDTLGKSNALNYGLKFVNTRYFITVDADTYLSKNAIQCIMNHITTRKSACVAGNLLVQNVKQTIFTKMQNYDYLLSIAAIKRYQGSYQSTLVAQGAFSAFETEAVRDVGGWENGIGEDIVLTYRLLKQKKASTYEPAAVGYTIVPETLGSLYNQRKRWATGMLEGLSAVKPWQQGTGFSRFFTFINLFIIYLDFAFVFGFVPGVIWACFGYYYFVGILTLLAFLISAILYFSVYRYQKRLGISFKNSFFGFICFLFFFQFIQSSASLHGYLLRLTKRKGEWK